MSFKQPDGSLWIRDFSPGYLDSPESDTIPKGATPDARNEELVSEQVDGGTRATLRKRRGSRLLNPTPMTAGTKVDGLFEFRRANAAGQLLAMCNGALLLFDDVDTFTSQATGWTAGNSARLFEFNQQAFIMDGIYQARWDGSNDHPWGFDKPSSVTAMGVAAGPGVTGTYQALYTWYDSATDHESSPSDATATQAYANEQRIHTKPGGSPPANVTHWRAYVRRTDTSESRFFRVATVLIATATHTEAVIDGARVDPAPSTNQNNAPPVFVMAGEFKGYAVAARRFDDSYYVSRLGDAESWNPKDRFRLPGKGEDLRCIVAYGTDLLLMKPHATYRLVGDALPFVPERVHSAYGCVSPDGAVEADDWLYAWDRVRGPYRSNLSSWQPLADARIKTIVGTLNKSAAADIRVAHDEANNRVVWAIPLGSQSRKRMLLAYSYLTQSWLPPQTGLEYGSLASFTSTEGTVGLFTGDHWGRVYELYATHEREGLPVGTPTDYTHTGTITSATASTATISGANFYTVGSGMAGMPVAAKAPSGEWQWRRIQSNTATTITLDTTNDAPWETTPAAGWQLVVGGIEWYRWTPWLDWGVPHQQKMLQWLFLQAKPQSENHEVEVRCRYNDDDGLVVTETFTFTVGLLSAIWDESEWDVALWSSTMRRVRKARLERTVFTVQVQLRNYYPDQPIEITMLGITADLVPGRVSPSIGDTEG